ncbi:xanthine dehydrogenase family protein subunit M [Halobacteria archaeon AArc-dxtr1]|nr:xanthine dehydrogenase family protein subunit M [Halobacteria archaeon AArc-dxtr1]
MYPDQFAYHRAGSVSEAITLLSEHPEATLLAGGHSLLPMMKSGLASPGRIIDIDDIDELSGIERSDGETRIGALTRYAAVVDDERLWEEATAFAEATQNIGDLQVRNRGTIGGNVAHADPASDLSAAVLVSDVTITVRGPDGERDVAADDFFHGMYTTAVGDGELVTAVSVPHDGTVGSYVKKPDPASGYALVGVATRLTLEDGTVTEARVAANGVMDHGVRLPEVEDVLVDEELAADTISAAGDVAGDSLDEYMVMDDERTSGEFRLQLLGAFTERALERAASRADGH